MNVFLTFTFIFMHVYFSIYGSTVTNIYKKHRYQFYYKNPRNITRVDDAKSTSIVDSNYRVLRTLSLYRSEYYEHAHIRNEMKKGSTALCDYLND
ncbi:hypothetical protein MKS88_004009 [Plasmodium brasilianum]|uniref:Uncharacterized protein n=1 Tax=Plasmodium brasilianum TaxID=5824 RepID=A0ACB9Y3L0_PLABR|nr:hypothetical protein MKS88_004009 [Plasmodium brasilianum]